jgi:hypothetical protein
VAVPSSEALKDRTYAAALALKEWISKSENPVRALTIYSRGAHARRTWMLFQMALKGQAKVGVIAGKDLRYDENRWWTTSEGVRDIIDETIAYLYARLFLLFSRCPSLLLSVPCEFYRASNRPARFISETISG